MNEKGEIKKKKAKENWRWKEKEIEKQKVEKKELSYIGPVSEEELLQNMETDWSRRKDICDSKNAMPCPLWA